ncbi:Cytosolic carboxypeptidase-like protein 5 [Desmophyllum pertusum]|uniref:tubulin-glutamate carboxypeptidase n=1 Tax=Desmophyllum pertusum TaxID=174260 RepID=A0A9W9Z2F4_9CNID|nr:Cytosolic carboxypeptidase-like protein 5 [Desmophyllum pertusum]
MMDDREEWLPHLFPDKTVPRSRRFEGKKMFFLSARVHPGETPSSFVFNGFLDFILRRDDPRAAALRNQYVFKLIPMLNPDGVKRGHYRTDPRDKAVERTVNLESSLEAVIKSGVLDVRSIPAELKPGSPDSESVKMELQSVASNSMLEKDDCNNNSNTDTLSENLNTLALEDKVLPPDVQTDSSSVDAQKEISIKNQLSNESASSMSSDCPSEKQSNTATLKQLQFKKVLNSKKDSPKCSSCLSKTAPESNSGVAYYVDLHGHASKRGCFVYANYLENEDNYVSSILFPKLVSLNSANFDFAACNFTEKNMYSKDKRDGMSKEGSGRVAIYKATGIVHSYTLECNYNCGRMANCVPPATCDSGCATPPPPQVGRAMAVAVLDMTNSNPWSRLPLSEFTSLEGVKNWVKRFVKSSKNAPSVPKKLSRVISKTSSMVAGATASTRQKLSALTSSSSDMSSDNTAAGGHRSTDHPSQNVAASAIKEAGKKAAGDTSLARRPFNLASTRKSSLQTPGTISGKNPDTSSSSPGTLPGGTSRDHLPGTGPARSQGPTLRLVHNFRHQPQVHVQHTPAASNKSLSSPVEIKMSTIDVHKQFVGFHRGKPGLVKNGHNSHSDEEKKKKSLRQRKKIGRRKEKIGETAVSDEMQPTQISLPRPAEEVDVDMGTVHKEEEGKSKGAQLSLRNSSKIWLVCHKANEYRM